MNVSRRSTCCANSSALAGLCEGSRPRSGSPFSKSKGWIKGYKIFANVHARAGEPDLYLVTISESIESAAVGDKRFEEFQAWKMKTISQMQTESGNRAEYREVLSDALLQEMTIRQ